MSPIRSLARPLLAAAPVLDGVAALRDPGPRAAVLEQAGLSQPTQLVQASAAAKVAGGLAFATGRLPRASALVLAATTAGSAWVRSSTSSGEGRRAALLQDLALVGGFVLAAADTGGRESVPHAAARVTRRAQRKAAKAAGKAEKALHLS